MKYPSLLALSFVILVSPFSLFAEDSANYEDISCFSHVNFSYNFNTSSDSIYFEFPEKNIQIMQNDTPLTITDVTDSLRYIPFQSNIGDLNSSDTSYNELYTFPSLDTNNANTIELSVDNLKAGNFKINFSHDARYHDAKYFISDDGDNYSQIGKQDSNDFDVKKMKIVFTPNTNEDIREVINISRLNIERTNFVLAIKNGNFAQDIDIYSGNTCNTINIVKQSSGQDVKVFASPGKGVDNYLYIQRITDSDNDGIFDLYDNCRFLSNPNQTDINTNSIGDACEFDSDNDGIVDEIDTCRSVANPGQEDDDKDGIGNICDNCELYNPAQIDTNNNGAGDVCEEREKFIQENDDDGDKIINGADNCKDISNSDQLDSDNDGIGNLCDNCPSFQNADQLDLNNNGVGDMCEDSDSDGIDSLQDNCPNIANPDQADRDNDGIGNLCEDDDRDTVLEINDNCPLSYNPDQRDVDNDKTGDACDESDDRMIESNRIVFIGLLLLGIMIFVGGIYFMSQKLKK